MAIEGLKVSSPEVPKTPTDEVGVAVEALGILGLVEDHEQVTESVAAGFENLKSTGVDGEKYLQLPRRLISLSDMIDVLDNSTYPEGREYPQTYVYDELWTPGTAPVYDRLWTPPGIASGSYKDEEIGNLAIDMKFDGWAPHGRIAVSNADNRDEREPLLHFLGKPYDDGKYEETQLGAIDKAVDAFGIEHEAYEMTPLNATAVAMIALQRRIKGEPMPMEWGYMRDATLPRRFVEGLSLVGCVNSYGGMLEFSGTNDLADLGGGVGLSVGPKDLGA